jgi:uncharacterized protein
LKVINETREKVLIENGHLADNLWTRFKGLMGVKKLEEGHGLIILPCNGVHCFFMSIPIDVLYVTRENTIEGMDKEMQPWHVGGIHGKARYVVELPAGAIERSGTQVGDRLILT